MRQNHHFNIDYPFGNPDRIQSEDAQSYYSFTQDDQKLEYFENFSQKAMSKPPQRIIKHKNHLPPFYPYHEVKKLKQQMKMPKTNRELSDLSKGSTSFQSVNDFHSIFYEEGDYERVNQQIYPQKSLKQKEKNNQDTQNYSQNPKHYQNNIETKQSQIRNNISQGSQQFQLAQIPIKQSSTLKEFDAFDLDPTLDKYQLLTERIQENFAEEKFLQEHDYLVQEEKQVQISQINQTLNKSQLIDHEIIQLTKELQMLRPSQQSLQIEEKYAGLCTEQKIHQNQQIEQFQTDRQLQKNKKINYWKEKFQKISNRLNQLKQVQKNFMQQVKKKMLAQEECKVLFSNQKEHSSMPISSKNNCLQSLTQRKTSSKIYNIRPKAPSNQSPQSKKYKFFTFEYCFGSRNQSEQSQWHELQIDYQNNPPEYKIIFSFQHQKSLLVIRIVDLIINENQISLSSGKKSVLGSSNFKKNYQYSIDFQDNKYQNNQQKLKSLSKELIVNLNEAIYVCKQFVKKIELFLIIFEDQTHVNLIRIIPLPNPLTFYIQKRFNFIRKKPQLPPSLITKQNASTIGQIENKTFMPRLQSLTAFKNLSNLHNFMKKYMIRIERMADVQSIQKLMNAKWINTFSSQQSVYFSIKSNLRPNLSLQASQLFYVKIEDFGVRNDQQSQEFDEKHNYSLTFTVASTFDNELLIDLIEFLTFLTVY